MEVQIADMAAAQAVEHPQHRRSDRLAGRDKFARTAGGFGQLVNQVVVGRSANADDKHPVPAGTCQGYGVGDAVDLAIGHQQHVGLFGGGAGVQPKGRGQRLFHCGAAQVGFKLLDPALRALPRRRSHRPQRARAVLKGAAKARQAKALVIAQLGDDVFQCLPRRSDAVAIHRTGTIHQNFEPQRRAARRHARLERQLDCRLPRSKRIGQRLPQAVVRHWAEQQHHVAV